MISIGDIVTRKSHNNDIVFKVINKEKNICYLKGVELRLLADADEKDLVKLETKAVNCDYTYADKVLDGRILNRSDYFYLPGKILHVDGDVEYLKKCMEFYKKAHVLAYGKSINEKDMPLSQTEKCEFDKKYLENMSFSFDFSIVIKSIGVVFVNLFRKRNLDK